MVPEATEVPTPRPDHGPGPGPVAGQLGHDDLAHRQHEDLGHHPDQVERAVALEHGQQLVPALELLQGHRVLRRPSPSAGQGLVDGPGAAGQLLEMPHPGIGGHDDAGPDHLGPPAQVEVLPHGHDGGVEAAELLEQVGPHQGGAAGGDEHVAHGIVLAVVDLAGLDPVDDRSPLVHGHPDMDQPLGVVPADHLGRDDAGVGTEGLLHQQVDGVGEEGHVVVAQQEVVGPVDHGLDLVDRGPEPTVLLEAAHVGRGQDRRHPGGEVSPLAESRTRTESSA